MRIGIHTTPLGWLADPAAVGSAARSAEQVGYSSLWVSEGARDADRRDGPQELDPLAVLAVSAAMTTRVRLGTSVVPGAGYDTATLTRALVSLDLLSEGRLTVGMGRMAAEGAGQAEPSADPLHRLLDELDRSPNRTPSPGRLPRPPVLLAATTDADFELLARRADGWLTGSLPLAAVADRWDRARDLASAYGRDPDRLQLVVRADLLLTERPVPGSRELFHGTVDQIADDLEATRRMGADEAILSLGGNPGLDEVLDTYARIAEAVGLWTSDHVA